MWSTRITMSGAVLIAAVASASAQTARTVPHADPWPLLVINDGPIVEPSPVVADEPAAKPKKGSAVTRSRPASPGNAVRPRAAATRSRAVSQGDAAVMQGTAWPAAYASAQNPMLASPPALDFPAAALKEPAHVVAPSPVAVAEPVRLATVPTPASQSSVPIMVVEPEPRAKSPREAYIWRLLLGALGGGVLGAAIVWFLVRLGTGRARLTPRRKVEAEQAMRFDRASGYDNRRDDRASAYDKGRYDSGERQDDRHWAGSREREETAPPWRRNRASAYDDRGAGSRGNDETGPRWRHDQASEYDDHRAGSRESDETRRRWRHDQASAYNSRWDSRETQKGDRPSGYKAAASAYDALWDALRDGEEIGRPSGHDANSSSDAALDARARLALPVESNRLDELGTTSPRAAQTRQRNAGKMLYDTLEQEITSLLGRPTDKNSQRQKADQPSGDKVASDYDTVRDSTEREATDHPSIHSAVSAYDAVRDARPRSASAVEPNPLDELGTTPPRAAEMRQRNAGKMLYDSLEQEITSLLGRSTAKNSWREKADQPSGRNAASAYDAVRDALSEGEEVDQSSGRDAASAHDAVRDALGEGEAVDQLGGRDTASAYDAVRDALSEGEEVDQPSSRDGATTDDNVLRDALREWKPADQPRRYKPLLGLPDARNS